MRWRRYWSMVSRTMRLVLGVTRQKSLPFLRSSSAFCSGGGGRPGIFWLAQKAWLRGRGVGWCGAERGGGGGGGGRGSGRGGGISFFGECEIGARLHSRYQL